jgi:hypothetical protein
VAVNPGAAPPADHGHWSTTGGAILTAVVRIPAARHLLRAKDLADNHIRLTQVQEMAGI